jgi:hypothetical protein
MTDSRIRRCALVVLAVLALAACGEKKFNETVAPEDTVLDYTTTTVDPAFLKWQTDTKKVCAEYEPKLKAITANHPVSSLSDFVELYEALKPTAEEYQTKLLEVEVPHTEAERINRLNDLNSETLADAAEQMYQAAKAGDAAAFKAASDQAGLAIPVIDALSDDLDVPECGAD